MLMEVEKERLMGDILRGSFEALTLEDLGSQVLPFIERVLDTSASLLYECDEHGAMKPFAGTHCELVDKYHEYYQQDPLQNAFHRLNPWIQHAPRLLEWKEYLRLPVYTEFAHRVQIENYIHMRLNDTDYHQPGMVGVMLARSHRQVDFSETDLLILAGILPSLVAAVRRSRRLAGRLRNGPLFESMLEENGQAILALDLRGKLLWASQNAASILEFQITKGSLPSNLVEAARRIRTCGRNGYSVSQPISSVFLRRPNQSPVRAELRLHRTRLGTPFLIAEIDTPGLPYRLKKAAARYRLTASETEVLRLISLGLSEPEIARRLFVSKATVHTHAGRVLAKLGVHSRIQAALIAHGLKPEDHKKVEKAKDK